MQPLRILQELRKKFCPSSIDNLAPPSYREASKPHPPSPENLKRITSKVPRWTWSTKECRDWLRAVCVVYFNFSLQEAEASAMKFEGFGATLYMKSGDSWVRLLGENGRGLYGLLFGLRGKTGCCTDGYEALELTAMHIHKERAAIRCFFLWILNGRGGYRQSYSVRTTLSSLFGYSQLIYSLCEQTA
jgi:hypothetical protein